MVLRLEDSHLEDHLLQELLQTPVFKWQWLSLIQLTMQESTVKKQRPKHIHTNTDLFKAQSSKNNMKLTCCSVEAMVCLQRKAKAPQLSEAQQLIAICYL